MRRYKSLLPILLLQPLMMGAGAAGAQAAAAPLFAPPLAETPREPLPTPTPLVEPSYSTLLAPESAPSQEFVGALPERLPEPSADTPAAPSKEAPVADAVSENEPVEPVEPVRAEGLSSEDENLVPLEKVKNSTWYTPSYWFGPTPWDSGFELGLNGASGTSESISFRSGGYVKRKNDDYKLDMSLYYNKTQSEGVEVQSNALLDARYDWLFEDSPWSLFIMSQTFYDEFQTFDVNLNANSGVGYQWLDAEWTKLTTSVGTGTSREFGGLDDRWVAEASFGVNYELQIDKSRKFYAKVDYFPELENFGNYRVLADTGLEIELNQPSNMSLKFSATDRYDSQPQGAEPHNLNYSALLIWKL